MIKYNVSNIQIENPKWFSVYNLGYRVQYWHKFDNQTNLRYKNIFLK